MFFKKKEYITEENTKIPIYGKKISKELKVFYEETGIKVKIGG